MTRSFFVLPESLLGLDKLLESLGAYYKGRVVHHEVMIITTDNDRIADGVHHFFNPNIWEIPSEVQPPFFKEFLSGTLDPDRAQRVRGTIDLPVHGIRPPKPWSPPPERSVPAGQATQEKKRRGRPPNVGIPPAKIGKPQPGGFYTYTSHDSGATFSYPEELFQAKLKSGFFPDGGSVTDPEGKHLVVKRNIIGKWYTEPLGVKEG